MAADGAAIKSTFFHPEHLLARRLYKLGASSTAHPCAACELSVTGAAYSCDECGFRIHKACLSLPLHVKFDGHPRHRLTLTRLPAGTSRRCHACGETSRAGRYTYLCAACDYDVHPRCRKSHVASSSQSHQGQPPPPPQAQQQAPVEGERRQGMGITRTIIKVGVFGFRVLDVFTGGLMSPVLDAIDSVL